MQTLRLCTYNNEGPRVMMGHTEVSVLFDRTPKLRTIRNTWS